MKVYLLVHREATDGDIMREWFVNRTLANERKNQLLKLYDNMTENERESLRYGLSEIEAVTVPNTKKELVHWLNNNAATCAW
jgi:hypothetical protein